ncbi:MAG: FHA domain-containing protein [Planctomycetota bacterium]
MKASAILVGRDIGSGIRVACRDVSRRHCELIPQGRGYFVRDLESANGTWIAGRRVHVGYVARGEVISVGSYQLRVEDDGRISSMRQSPAPTTTRREISKMSTIRSHIVAWTVILAGALVAFGTLILLEPDTLPGIPRSENPAPVNPAPVSPPSMQSDLEIAAAPQSVKAHVPLREAYRGPWVHFGRALAQRDVISRVSDSLTLPASINRFEIAFSEGPNEIQDAEPPSQPEPEILPEPEPQLDVELVATAPPIPVVDRHEIAALLALGRERIDGFQLPPRKLEPLREIVAGLLTHECNAAVDALLDLRAQCQNYATKLATRLRRNPSSITPIPKSELERTIARDLRAQLLRVLERQYATLQSFNAIIDDALASLNLAESWCHALDRVLTSKDVELQKRFVRLVATQQRTECVPLLVERLSSVSYQVTSELYKALESLTGARPGRSATAWRKWRDTQER